MIGIVGESDFCLTVKRDRAPLSDMIDDSFTFAATMAWRGQEEARGVIIHSNCSHYVTCPPVMKVHKNKIS